MRRRRPAASPRPAARALVPRLHGVDLAPWTPAPPHGATGWTAETAWSAAWTYAEEHAARYAASPSAVAVSAFLALAAATPGLHRADVVERLSGGDRSAALA